MAGKFKYVILCVFFSVSVFGQWLHKSNLPGPARWKASSFLIGDYIYVVGGADILGTNLNDVWRYDINANTWMPMADFPGIARCSAVAFAVGNYGYLATGDIGNNNFLKDMWQYDPVSDTWTQKHALGIGWETDQRSEAIAFSIGTKAYIGYGEGWKFEEINSLTTLNGFLEYDTQTDTWTYPLMHSTLDSSMLLDSSAYLGFKMAIATTLNNKAYFGLGGNLDQKKGYKKFWAFDPVDSTLTRKADFPSEFTLDAAAFSFKSKIYVAGGVSPSDNYLSKQFYEYDPITDTWRKLNDLECSYLSGQIAVSNGTRAFMGTGFTGALTTSTDLWELKNIVAASTGIVENSDKLKDVYVFPNPATDKISIRSSYKISGIDIFDVRGASVLNEKINFSKISLTNLDNGIYFIKVNHEDQKSSILKFIKNN